MPEIVDPPTAPEASNLQNQKKARELVNLAVVLQPIAVRVAEDKKKDPPEQFEIVDCHYWLLGPGGIEEAGDTGISWWRAREQLRGQIGNYVACRPKQQADNSITLEPLQGAAREAAAKAVVELAAQPVVQDDPLSEYSDEAF